MGDFLDVEEDHLLAGFRRIQLRGPGGFLLMALGSG
jgi:hypothetical protein